MGTKPSSSGLSQLLWRRLLGSLEGPLRARLSLWIGFLIAFSFVVYLFHPYFQPLFFGAVLAALLLPLHRFAVGRLHFPPQVSAFLLTIFSLFLVTSFFVLLAIVLVPQLIAVFHEAQEVLGASSNSLWVSRLDAILNPLGTNSKELLVLLRTRFIEQGAGLVQQLAETIQNFLSWTTELLLNFFITLVTTYILLLYSSQVHRFVDRFSPFPEELKEKLITQFRNIVRAFFVGGVGTALIQGGAASLGYVLVSLPGVPALFLLTTAAAFIPFLGTALIWGPIVVYFFLSGATVKALFLAIYCIGIVATLDQWIKPWIMGSALELPVVVMFLTFFGGIKTFGLSGIILGPLIFSYFLTIVQVLMEFAPDTLLRFPSHTASNSTGSGEGSEESSRPTANSPT